MTKQSDTPRVPDLMEAIFDTCYLLFDLIAGILFFAFSHGSPLFLLYGVLTWTLCFGDAFHLVPRVLRAVKGSSEKIERQLGIGLQISSITMTIFYILLLYIWKQTFYEMTAPVMLEILIWVSAAVRIVVCMLPQNNWCGEEGNRKLSVIRNAVFGRDRHLCNCAVCDVRQYLWIPYDAHGGGDCCFIRLLSAGHAAEQENAENRHADDSKDLCVYLDDRHGFAAAVLMIT